jgi:hypothetical protein
MILADTLLSLFFDSKAEGSLSPGNTR